MSEVFEVLIEKKGRGRGAFTISRPWAVRTIKLKEQNLEYYDVDKLKGNLSIKDAICRKLTPEEADSKPFPFEVDVGKEKLILNASCEEIRAKCLEVFSLASKSVNWSGEMKANANAEEAKKNLAALELEAKRLDAEQKQQQTAGVASVFQEQQANKALEDAATAEARQKEEQQKAAMQTLLNLGGKARMRAALAAGQQEIAKAAAASMLQSAWRGKVAKRTVAQKKAEKENLRRDGYARKIQSRYRARLAKRRVEQIKAEKLALKNKIVAVKIQCAWRVYYARKLIAQRKEFQLQSTFAKTIQRQRGIIRFQNKVRGFLARRRLVLLLNEVPAVVHVTVTACEGLSGNSADPGVIVAGLSLAVPRDDVAITKSRYSATDEVLKTAKITSIHRTENVSAKKTALVTAESKLDYVMITLVDRNSPGKDDGLGQAFIRVSDIRRIPKNADGSVDVTVPLKNNLVSIEDFNGKIMVRRAATGTVTVNVHIADPSYSMCGWLWKVSEKLLAGNAWKKRWFVLVEGKLLYFNSELALEASKHIVNCERVTAIAEETFKGRTATKISYSHDGSSNFWQLDFDEDVAADVKKMWQRKISRSTLLADPEIEALRAKFNIVKKGSKSSRKTGQKRGSLFE